MSQNSGIVHLWELPENKVCIKLPENIQKDMINKALSKVNGRYELARKIKVKPVNIYDFEKSRFDSMTLKFVKRLSKFLVSNGFKEFSLEKLETQLELIKSKFLGIPILYPKFPIDFNSNEGASIISGILFDGGITQKLYPFYTNNEEILVDRMIGHVGSVVGKIFHRKRKDGNTHMCEFSKILGLILVYGLNMKPGKKTLTDPSIPKFIKNNKELQLSFLQQALDDEGSLNLGKSGKCIELQQYSSFAKPPKRLLELKSLIENFGIHVNGPYGPTRINLAKNNKITYGWGIQISNQSDIRTFTEKINFTLERKQKN